MKLQCVQEALADALATVGRVVPGKATLPVLSNVLLETDGPDCLRLTASNLDLTVSRRVRAIVKAEGARLYRPVFWRSTLLCSIVASRFRFSSTPPGTSCT